MESLTQFFVDWGYSGMFLAALAAGSIIPIGSEVVFVLLAGLGLDPLWLIVAATAGNTLGGMTCYWVGMLGKREWLVRLGVTEQKLQRATQFLKGRGAWMAFFAFAPYIGEAIAVALGFMRSNMLTTAVAMSLGKAVRYVVLWLGYLGVLAL